MCFQGVIRKNSNILNDGKDVRQLSECLTELCTSDFYLIFFSFWLSLIFKLRYQFPAFFQAVFQADENPSAQVFPD